MSELRFHEDIEIDMDALDEEWQEQPTRFQMYSTASAKAKRELDELKLAFKVAKAKTASSIRSGDYPDAPSKITEGVVKELLEGDSGLAELEREIIAKQEEVDMIDGAVIAFQHRKHALIKICDLWMSGYHQDSRTETRKKALDTINRRRKDG